MRRLLLPYAAFAILAVGCDGSPSAPAAPATAVLMARDNQPEGRPAHEHARGSFTRTVMNACGPVPEPVIVQGHLIYNSHFKFFEGGNSNRLMTNIQGSGVGVITGLKYQFHQLETIHGHYTYANEHLEATRETRVHLVSQSDANNFFMTMKVRQVCDGPVCRDDIVAIETDCRG